MNDLFARTGTAIEVLLAVSTVNGDQRHEILRLVEELKAADANITGMVNERVQAGLEEINGRIAALEEGKAKADAVVFSTGVTDIAIGAAANPEEAEHLTRVLGVRPEKKPEEPSQPFNGADPASFDHDGDGSPGGSTPVPPADDIEDMTVPMLKDALDKAKVDYDSQARKADLQALLRSHREASGQTDDPGA